jgi:translation initiation factor IF-3
LQLQKQSCRIIRNNIILTPILKPKINNQINSPQLRVIDETGANLGVLPLEEALRLAKEKNLDLIEIAPNANPPVAKLMEYGKYLYEKERQDRRKRAKERKDVVKTIRLTFGMSQHDMAIRARKALELFKDSNRLQIQMLLRGRQKVHPEVAKKKLEGFLLLLPESIKIISEEKTPQGFQLLIAKNEK